MNAHELSVSLGGNGKLYGREYKGICPIHDDKDPSLGIKDGDNGYPVLYCRTGCSSRDIFDHLRSQGFYGDTTAYSDENHTKSKPKAEQKSSHQKKPKYKSPAPWERPVEIKYNYIDENGKLRYQNVKFSDGKKPRFMIQRGEYKWNRGDASALLYKLPELIKSKGDVYIVEGEKDVDNLAELGFTVTTSGASDSWLDEFAKWFKNRNVIIVPDNDRPGYSYAAKILGSICGVANTVKIIIFASLDKKQDISDWISLGGNKGKLSKIIESVSQFDPKILPDLDKWGLDKDRTERQFRSIIGVVSDNNPTKLSLIKPNKNEKTTQQKIAALDFNWVHTKQNGLPLSTVENLEQLLDAYSIGAKYNIIKKEFEFRIPNSINSDDNGQEESMVDIVSLANKHRIPRSDIERFSTRIAGKHSYNQVAEWIDSKPWDFADRIEALTESLGTEDIAWTMKLLRLWLISAVAAVYEPNGVSARGVIILQGPQSIGKTSWFWSLIDGNEDFGLEGAIIDPTDKDSVLPCLQSWITESGEFGTTARKSGIDHIKTFFGKEQDTLFLRYSKYKSKYARRTVFIGTINEGIFIHDSTGSSRFWVIPVTMKMNARHGINMQQLWAQVKIIYEAGESWNMAREDIEELERRNTPFKAVSPFFELISEKYNMDTIMRSRRSASMVCIELGYRQPRPIDVRQCSEALKSIYGEPYKYNRVNVWDLPEREL